MKKPENEIQPGDPQISDEELLAMLGNMGFFVFHKNGPNSLEQLTFPPNDDMLKGRKRGPRASTVALDEAVKNLRLAEPNIGDEEIEQRLGIGKYRVRASLSRLLAGKMIPKKHHYGSRLSTVARDNEVGQLRLANPELTNLEIATRSGFSVSQVMTSLKRLFEEKMIPRKRPGRIKKPQIRSSQTIDKDVGARLSVETEDQILLRFISRINKSFREGLKKDEVKQKFRTKDLNEMSKKILDIYLERFDSEGNRIPLKQFKKNNKIVLDDIIQELNQAGFVRKDIAYLTGLDYAYVSYRLRKRNQHIS